MFIDSYATDTVVDLNDFWIKKKKTDLEKYTEQ